MNLLNWLREKWRRRHEYVEAARWSNEVDRLARRLEDLARNYPEIADPPVVSWFTDHRDVAQRNWLSVWPKEECVTLYAQMSALLAELERKIYEEGE